MVARLDRLLAVVAVLGIALPSAAAADEMPDGTVQANVRNVLTFPGFGQ